MLPKIIKKLGHRLSLKIQEKWHGLLFVEPDYYIKGPFRPGNIIIDCGTGDNADFSQNIITKYGVKCHGFEPTRKHHPRLKEIVDRYGGLFEHHPLAISSGRGKRTFHESMENISGSFLNDHINIINDTVNSYEVETITIDDLFDYLEIAYIDLLKIDIEGEEYPVLNSISDESLGKIGQISVEFHHYCVKQCMEEETHKISRRLVEAGYKSFCADGKTYLFFRS